MSLSIAPAAPADLPALDAGLRALARDLGDPHRATIENLEAALFAAAPAAAALIAKDRAGDARGLALFQPRYSTVFGGAGAFVSDLWVETAHRGRGTGRALLAAIADDARRRWRAIYLELTVYEDNPRARALYAELGFSAREKETKMTASIEGLLG